MVVGRAATLRAPPALTGPIASRQPPASHEPVREVIPTGFSGVKTASKRFLSLQFQWTWRGMNLLNRADYNKAHFHGFWVS